jgi:tetratricopeptide (TPR) repeat protein/TolB-like protein
LVVLLACAVGLASIPSARQRIRAWVGISSVPREKQVVVLPFTVIGTDAEGAAFSEGLTETLTAKLTQLTAGHNLQVISANEVGARHVRTAEQARKEFGATLSLEGSLHRSGNLVRINYALVDTRTREQLRAGSITAAATDPFAAQDQVVTGAIAMLELELQPREKQALEVHGTQVPGAYNFYLEGRGYLSNYDRPENIESAIASFRQALALDANYALAYAGLGDAYWKKYQGSKQAEWVDDSRQACQHALSLDAKLAAAHICMGTLANGTGQYEQAAAEFNRALEIEPTSDDSYRGLAEAYERLGIPAEAEKTYQRAIQLRPEYWAGYSWLGVFYYHQARYADAAKMFQKVVALVPDSFRGYSNLGAAYMDGGHYAEAVPMFEHSLAIRPSAAAYSNLGTAYFFQHQFADAAAKYEQAVQISPGNYVYWRNLGDACYWDPAKHSQAASAYRKSITLAQQQLQVNSRDASALGVIALCHSMLQEKPTALRALQAALRLTPQDPDLLLMAAEIYQVLGQTKPGLDELSKALAAGISPVKVRADPIFDKLHGNTAFEDLLRSTQPTPRRKL